LGRPFDLRAVPLLRARFVELREDVLALLLTMHHIVSDAWTGGILRAEIRALYGAFRDGEPSPLPEPAIQYADYAAWQRRWLSGEVLQAQLDYWSNQLAGVPPLELPTDRPRPPVASLHGGQRTALLSKTLLDAVRAVGRPEG